MYHKSDSITFHSELESDRYFFSRDVNQSVTNLAQLLDRNEKIHVYPEATIKSNRFPNGISVVSPYKDATIIPSLLRDPGCGFLLFRVCPSKYLDIDKLKSAIITFGKLTETGEVFDFAQKEYLASRLESILLTGMDAADAGQHYDQFVFPSFELDAEAILLSEEHIGPIMQEFNNITNTIELKKVMSCDLEIANEMQLHDSDLIGFIHTGTDFLAQLMHQLWFQSIASYCIQQGKTDTTKIAHGIYGVPLNEDVGYAYFQWSKLIMNYTVVKRYYLFKALALYLKSTLGLELELINDRVHAGAFVKSDQLIQSRGVQDISISHSIPSKNIFLVAGQRETISYLLMPKPLTQDTSIGHGTSYAISDQFNYKDKLTNEKSERYLSICDETLFNGEIHKDRCLAYTYNIRQQIQYLQRMNYCSSVICLQPLANYMSQRLLKVLANEYQLKQ